MYAPVNADKARLGSSLSGMPPLMSSNSQVGQASYPDSAITVSESSYLTQAMPMLTSVLLLALARRFRASSCLRVWRRRVFSLWSIRKVSKYTNETSLARRRTGFAG